MITKQSFTPTGQVIKVRPMGLGSNRRGTLVDESGNGHNATIVGCPALTFDGANDKARVYTPWDWIGSARYATIACWLYHSADATDGFFWSEFNGGGTSQIKLEIAATTHLLQLYARGVSGDVEKIWSGGSALTEDAWHSVVIQIDSTDSDIHYWIDGVAQVGGALSGSISAFGADVPNAIEFGTDGTSFFAGRINYIGIGGLAAVLTDADAEEFHNSPAAWLAGSGLGSWWPCTDGSSATMLDQSGNNRSLAGTGVSWGVATNFGDSYVNDDTIMGVYTDGNNAHITLDTTAFFDLGSQGTLKAHAVGGWFLVDTNHSVNNARLFSTRTNAGDISLRIILQGANYDMLTAQWDSVAGSALLAANSSSHPQGVLHSYVFVFDNADTGGSGDAFLYVDGVLDGTDVACSDLCAPETDTVRLHAVTSDGTDGECQGVLSVGCILDLDSATVDGTFRAALATGWHNSGLPDLEDAFTAISAATDGNIPTTYWKCNELSYAEKVDTNNIVGLYSRTITTVNSGSESLTGTTSDSENSTGFPIATSGDGFKSSGLWLDRTIEVDFGDHADFSFTDGGGNDDPFSLAFWIDIGWLTANDHPNGGEYLFLKTLEYGIYLHATLQRIYFIIYDSGGDNIHGRTSSNVVTEGLHHIVGTYDGSNANTGIEIYLDGTKKGLVRSSGGVYNGMSDSGNSLKLVNLHKNILHGSQLYNRELTAQDVVALYEQGAYV